MGFHVKLCSGNWRIFNQSCNWFSVEVMQQKDSGDSAAIQMSFQLGGGLIRIPLAILHVPSQPHLIWHSETKVVASVLVHDRQPAGSGLDLDPDKCVRDRFPAL
jgi:hypothetical protein